MSETLTRLCQIIAERYQRPVSYVEMNPYADSDGSDIVDLINRNRRAKKIISGDALVVPVRLGESVAGAAVIQQGITLTETEIDAVVDTVELLFDGYVDAADRGARVRQLENYLENTSPADNVVYLHNVRSKNKDVGEQILVGRHQGPYLTQILLEGKPGIPFKELAFDIHQKSGRSSFISWDDLDSDQISKASDIAELGPITIFIPNLSELSKAEQAVLDGYMLELMGENTPRLIAAVQSPMNALVESGALRSTLAFYFSKAHLKIPALVERKEDILELVDFFSKAHSQGQKDLSSFGLETLSFLTEYDWPGNEKELETEIQKIVEQVKKDKIGVENLPVKIVGSEMKQLYRLVRSKTSLKEASEELEAKMVQQAMAKAGGNKSEASRLLGLSRSALLEKLERLEKSGYIPGE
ncbi:MAG TPA: helix-turn-helix domain-containing protein [Bdellovibrionales bacterium]|nr:helix-turn-helix domain-containing protein [Bdellovibrionales bacterium]